MILHVLLLFGVSTVAAAAELPCGHLPEELRTVAQSVGCGPVPGFFDRPGMVDPPYLYGYLPGDREASAIFWCFEASTETYLLVSVQRGRLNSMVRWTNFPGGLSLSDRDWDLSEFRYVAAPERFGPAGVRTRHRPVVSEYDGVATVFYEHEGEWLFLMID